MKAYTVFLILVFLLASLVPTASAAPAPRDYLISAAAPLTAAQVDQLRAAGAHLNYVYKNFGGAAIRISPEKVVNVSALPFVASVDEDIDYELASVDFGMAPSSYSGLPGTPFWLDLIDAEKNTTYDGSGVWVAVLDRGFFPNWQDYFDVNSILTEYATAFIGADDNPNLNQWDNATSAHGMAVAATIVGYRLVDKEKEGGFGEGYLTGNAGTYWVPGVAPGAKIIPVNVCVAGCKGFAVNAGIDYIIGLKLKKPDQPMVINMSQGHLYFNALEKAALDAAIGAGVIIVASAGNSFESGMGFPAAYEPVISAGAGGWRDLWNQYPKKTWWLDDVPENGVDEVFMTNFSSRQLPGQYLDVVSTGRDLLLPFPCPNGVSINNGACGGKATPDNASSAPFQYAFVNGTSFASPTIAGIVALMLEKDRSLNNADANFGTLGDPSTWGPGELERLLEGSATEIPPGTVVTMSGYGFPLTVCWEMGTPGCTREATGHGWVFVDDALAAVP